MNNFIFLVPLLLAGYFVSTHIDGNTYSVRSSLIAESSKLKAEMNKVDSGVLLNPTIDNWILLENLTKKSGVSLVWIEDILYAGKHHSYSGMIQGESKYVISILGSIQKKIPLIIHTMESINGMSKVKVSILGVNQ